MNSSQFPIARKSGLVIQEMPDEVLVYDLDSNKAHCLNQTAATVWKACDGNTSITEISRICGDSGNEDLVWLAIDQLSENNLLEKSLTSNFKGQSRREVIKKSLVAPQGALAATSCNCVNNNGCNQGPNLGHCPSTKCDTTLFTCTG